MIKSVYLAYPIDQAGPAHLTYLFEQINKFKGMVATQVSWVFDPGDAFTVNPRIGIDSGLATINRAALNYADALVAFLPAGVPTVGVPIEIDRARAQGKPVLVFTDTDSYMLALPGIARINGWDTGSLDEGFVWLMDQEPYDGVHIHGEIPFTGNERFTPVQSYPDDAGYDLFVSRDTHLLPGEFQDVPCGIAVEMPERVWGMVTARSSTLRSRGLLVHPGIIDTGYRGPLFAACYNMAKPEGPVVQLKEGERIAQLILFNNTTMRYKPMPVDTLTPSPRGEKGFGSSGA